MPFDNTSQHADPTGLAPEHRAKLETLERALRGDMPEGFRWDFGVYHLPDFPNGCGSVGCALGLAHELGLIELTSERDDVPAVVIDQLGLTGSPAAAIFHAYESLYGCEEFEDITPAMVADKLRHFLDTGRVE